MTQGSLVEVHASEVHSFLQCMPQRVSPVIFGVDANTPFKWVAKNEFVTAVGDESKGEHMIGRFLEAGLHFSTPPRAQFDTPTCRPRNTELQGRHIDVVGGSEGKCNGTGVVCNSHRFIGSDHDLVAQGVQLAKGSRGTSKPNTRPRFALPNFAVPEIINQRVLADMASTCSRPYQGVAYRDPQHVKVHFQVARKSGQAEDWKRALRERDVARREWREERIQAATDGNWQAYRDCQKKGARGWEDHFAATMFDKGVDPHQAVHDHFRNVYKGQPIPPFPFSKQQVPISPDFTLEELRAAIRKGKNGKSTGEDRVSHELIKAINLQPQGEERFLAWFNCLLHGVEPLPADWGRAVMIVLPKCAKPEHVKDLRPICLGSSANKIYARMLLERTKPAFQYGGPFQNMGAGRQTIDYVWIVSRLMSLDQEWKKGLYFFKLDIAKAFDTLHRGKFLSRLPSKLGCCEELRGWWDLFSRTEAHLCTAWGSSTVPMSSGIRQGSVESPQAFASAMDWVIRDTIAKHGWNASNDVYEGLEFAESAFVDDCILWNGNPKLLETRISQLVHELSLWGLRVNPDKSQLYVSPFAVPVKSIKVGDKNVVPDTKLDVMGIPFRVGIAPKEAMQGIFARAKGKFWANKHLFRAKTGLAGRLKLMQKVLGNAGLWCAGAFVPDKQALHAANVVQAEMVIWSMRLAKPPHETWKDFRIRCFRSAMLFAPFCSHGGRPCGFKGVGLTVGIGPGVHGGHPNRAARFWMSIAR